MKLFMEINPQLFDDCSHEYTETQNSAEQREMARQNKWKYVAEQAKRAQANGKSLEPRSRSASTAKGPKATTPMRIDEVDPMTEDSQKRLDALKLQDGAAAGSSRDGKERRPREYDRQNSVSSSRSQR